MDSIVGQLADQQAELTGLLAGLDTAGWELPSPCEGWSVADVVLHVAQTNELAIGSATGRFGEVLGQLTSDLGEAQDVDEGAARMVERERGGSYDELRDRWQSGADELVAVLRGTDPHDRVTWVAGTLSARTLATTRLAETWIHTGDVARSLGRPIESSERLEQIARLAWRTLPYAFERARRSLSGPVAFDLAGPGGARWRFAPDHPAASVIRGDALELCLVAARRVDAAATGLQGEGPDAATVLELVRTYA